jgi:ElaB/YqjD/DUF883 family membrane-anchored ribosome-binding protein
MNSQIVYLTSRHTLSMSKTRKEKLVDELIQMIEDAENLLVSTPGNVTEEEYQETIERIEYLRGTLNNVLKM